MNLAVDAVELRAFFVKRVSKFRSVGNGGTFFDGTLFHFLATFPPSLPPPSPAPQIVHDGAIDDASLRIPALSMVFSQ